ncbi:hypothetical protein SAMD00019534_124120, partial [Acytostelium subglobosum LB1]|uniref:hypothetical protein n=1 Tax=Acytostelium subglobosum LB1 TaxID=1410327 RepID=UPI000644DE8B
MADTLSDDNGAASSSSGTITNGTGSGGGNGNGGNSNSSVSDTSGSSGNEGSSYHRLLSNQEQQQNQQQQQQQQSQQQQQHHQHHSQHPTQQQQQQIEEDDAFDLNTMYSIPHHYGYYGGFYGNGPGARRRHSYEKGSSNSRRPMIPMFSWNAGLSSSSSSSSSRSPSPHLFTILGDNNNNNNNNGQSLPGASMPSISSSSTEGSPPLNSVGGSKYLKVPSMDNFLHSNSASLPSPLPVQSDSLYPPPLSTSHQPTPPMTLPSFGGTSVASHHKSHQSHHSPSTPNPTQSATVTPSGQQQQQQHHHRTLEIKHPVYEKTMYFVHFILSVVLLFNVVLLVSKHFFYKLQTWSGERDSVKSLLLFINPFHVVFSLVVLLFLFLQLKVRILFEHNIHTRSHLHHQITKKEQRQARNSSELSDQDQPPIIVNQQAASDPSSSSSSSQYKPMFIARSLDYMFLGLALSGFVNTIFIQSYFNPKDDSFDHDTIFNICSAVEFIFVGITLNFASFSVRSTKQHRQHTHHRGGSTTSHHAQQQQQEEEQPPKGGTVALRFIKKFLARVYLSLAVLYILLVARVNYEPLGRLITAIDHSDDITLNHFQLPLLLIIYFLQIVLLFFEYSQNNSYRLASMIISTLFVWLIAFDATQFSFRSFESFPMERLVMRRWIRCFVVAFPCIGTSLDYIVDWKIVNNRYNDVLHQMDGVLQENLHFQERIGNQKRKVEINNQFLTSTLSQFKKTINSASPMIGFLMDSDVQPHQAPYLQKISKAFDQLNQMSKEVLYFSEIKALKSSDCERTLFGVEALMEEIIANPTTRSYFEEREVDLCYLIAPNVPATITGDPTKLKHILHRLVNTGLKTTYQGEIVVKVTTQPDPNRPGTELLSFSVTDTGCGVEEDVMPAMFEPYVLAMVYGFENEFGIGLDMPICYQLSVLLGGTL